MTFVALDAPSIATRFAQAGASSAQAEVLQQAFGAYGKAVQEHEQALHALQDAVQHLQQAQAQRDAEYNTSRMAALGLAHQVKTLEESTREHVTKGDVHALRVELKSDIALVHKDVDLLRKDMEVGFAKMDARFAEAKTDSAVLRKDMEAQNLSIRKDMEAQNLSIRKDMEAMQNKLVIKLGSMMVVLVGAVVAVVKMLPQ